MEKFAGKISSTTPEETKRGDIRHYKSNCNSGYKVVYQKGNKFSRLKGFLLSDKYKDGVTFSDGSRLLIQGWITVVRMGEYFQLLPINGFFGFCNGLMGSSELEKKALEKTNISKTEVFYALDGNVMYEVKTIFIEADFEQEIKEKQFSFDLFNGQKTIAVLKGGNKLGLIIDNNLHNCENFKIDPFVGQVLKLII
ncbi:MAG: hypothetical protein PHO75_03045 [Candidatus Shapirobacteria bacterium]|nr:hypothetical protein [Candidatus Shapirobacteria bacterium]